MLTSLIDASDNAPNALCPMTNLSASAAERTSSSSKSQGEWNAPMCCRRRHKLSTISVHLECYRSIRTPPSNVQNKTRRPPLPPLSPQAHFHRCSFTGVWSVGYARLACLQLQSCNVQLSLRTKMRQHVAQLVHCLYTFTIKFSPYCFYFLF